MEGFYDECLDASSGVYRFFQDGAWKTSSSGKTVKIINPSTNQPVFSVQGAPAPPAAPACLERLHTPFTRCAVAPEAIGPAGCRNGRNRAIPLGWWSRGMWVARSTGLAAPAATLPACSLHPGRG